MTRYMTKPLEIDAIFWTGANLKDVKSFVNEMLVEHLAQYEAADINMPVGLFVKKANNVNPAAWNYISEGQNWDKEITAAVYDYLHQTWVGVKDYQYVICGTKGEFYPCDEDVFKSKYEEKIMDR